MPQLQLRDLGIPILQTISRYLKTFITIINFVLATEIGLNDSRVHHAASVAPLRVLSALGLSQEHLQSLAGGWGWWWGGWGTDGHGELTLALTVSALKIQVSAIDFSLDKQSKCPSLMSLAHGHIIFP